MKRGAIGIVLLLLGILGGCASHYANMDALRAASPQATTVVPVPFGQAFARVRERVSECFAMDPYRVLAQETGTGAEVAVIAYTDVQGSNVWLGARLTPEGTARTRIDLNWGNANWERHAQKVPVWAEGGHGCY